MLCSRCTTMLHTCCCSKSYAFMALNPGLESVHWVQGHEHHHHHGHGHGQETSAAERFGIRSFVYSRRRPFHSQR